MSSRKNTLEKHSIGTTLIQTAICVILDQATKFIAQTELKGHVAQSYLGNIFRLEYAENPGAFLSLGAHLPAGLRFWLLTALTGVFLLGVIIYLFTHPKLDRATHHGLVLVTGGGVSNLLDRIFRENGNVVDFLNVGIGSLRTGIFNIADMAIMLGVIILFFKGFNVPQSKKGGP